MRPFVHLHLHTQYSILDGASNIDVLLKKAQKDGMRGVAITDHGNMFGVKEFANAVKKINGKVKDEIKSLKAELETATNEGTDTSPIQQKLADAEARLFKPIIGCECYVAHNSRHDKKGKENASGDHLIILAKNKTGYHNLVKLVSISHVEGFYYKPRIDKEILEQYKEGLIITSACLGGEVPRKISSGNLEAAEQAILWFKQQFGDDYYLEMQRHPTNSLNADRSIYPLQQQVNEQLINFSKKLGVKLIATNDVHFINSEDAEAHDRLLCLNTGADLNDPNRMMYTKQEWFKTQEEMNTLFADVPEALDNTIEICDKIEYYDIDSKPIMPDFPLPEGFTSANDYLEHLTWEGAKTRYGELNDEQRERIRFELDTIKNMGFPGYFLIVQDFIAAARNMGVAVGPGRGSAAGSAVAYCLRITDIDPIKYDLLFERFLNPDRISMPDIDIDFDDDGREDVLRWVQDKYGKDRVAHIVTFGCMAAKSAIKDVARVQKLPIDESNRLSKLIPDGASLGKLNKEYINEQRKSDDPKFNSQELTDMEMLVAEKEKGTDLIQEIFKYAEVLEGSVRNTGVHACGVIIGKDDLKNYIPLSTTKNSAGHEVLVTQFEGKFVEDVGMLKMDFLGLKTLSIIKECIKNIKNSIGKDINIDTIPLDDAKTYELYSRGETTGTFQFESDGMKQHLRSLKPTKFEDLIAMNALYRPGPMEYIPEFIDRKHGRKPIMYDFPIMENRLKDTYGITVYQEQVMLLSRDLAGFTRGQSDELRKAMGKKLIDKMEALKVKFIEGCEKNGYGPREVLEKVWGDWAEFAKYAFNKSHATCYSWVAYQTGYLKANYPAQYMSAVLSRNISDITKISTFMEECKRMGLHVLGPDVNESDLTFGVNRKGKIRFGLGAIKGVGEAAVISIVDERKKNGPYTSIYDFVERVNLNAVNKKNLEALAYAGAFDAFCLKRSQYFESDTANSNTSFLENLLRYGQKVQGDKNNTVANLFGESISVEMTKPEAPNVEDWPIMEQLNKEKEYIGIYLSAHPLDPFKMEFEKVCSNRLAELENMDLASLGNKEITVGGLIVSSEKRFTKTNRPYGDFTIEDYSGTRRIMLFGKDFDEFWPKVSEPRLGILVRMKVQQRYNSNELELKVTSIRYLADVREDMVRSIKINLPVELIDEPFIKSLEKFTDNKKGKVQLKINLYDLEENISIPMISRNTKLVLSNEFLDFIGKFEGIDYQLQIAHS